MVYAKILYICTPICGPRKTRARCKFANKKGN